MAALFIISFVFAASMAAGNSDPYSMQNSVYSDNSNNLNSTTSNHTGLDTDGDGFQDQSELDSGSDPYDEASTPVDLDGDGVPNSEDKFPEDPDKWEKDDLSYYYFISYILIFELIIAFAYVSYTRITQRNVLNHNTRLKVYEFIILNPGAYFKDISEQLNINKSTLRYHLKNLQDTGQIKVIQDGKFKYYFPIGYNDSLFLTPIQKEIIEVLKQNESLTTKELAYRTGKARQTMLYHLNNLRNKNLLRYGKINNNIVFWYLDENVIDSTHY
ncbi:MAG: winged helix-turn-helix transcriptional regulator [Thermoplasmata archaeon]|nr:MAG: winged helix-turn-helix transcriptional regulator [Thermoplasmata archaeon]